MHSLVANELAGSQTCNAIGHAFCLAPIGLTSIMVASSNQLRREQIFAEGCVLLHGLINLCAVFQHPCPAGMVKLFASTIAESILHIEVHMAGFDDLVASELQLAQSLSQVTICHLHGCADSVLGRFGVQRLQRAFYFVLGEAIHPDRSIAKDRFQRCGALVCKYDNIALAHQRCRLCIKMLSSLEHEQTPYSHQIRLEFASIAVEHRCQIAMAYPEVIRDVAQVVGLHFEVCLLGGDLEQVELARPRRTAHQEREVLERVCQFGKQLLLPHAWRRGWYGDKPAFDLVNKDAVVGCHG